MSRLDGKVVFITGVARGQGRSHAIRFAQEGADIIGIDALTDVETVGYPMAVQDDLDETVKQVEALDRSILVSKVDVRDGPAVKRAVDDGVAQLGRLDAVVANAGELAPHKIRVNTVHPTNVDTPMIQNEFTRAVFFPDRDPSTITKEDAEPAFAQTNLLPIAWVEPEEISEAILFLISDTGRHITGITFPVDAGYSTK